MRETKEEKKNRTFAEHFLRPRPSTSARHSSLRTRLRGEQETEAQNRKYSDVPPTHFRPASEPSLRRVYGRKAFGAASTFEVATVKPAQRYPVTSLLFPPEQLRPLPLLPLDPPRP